MVLETGDRQPEAIALYLSTGYTPSPKFGFYRFYDSSRCMAKPLQTPAPTSPATPSNPAAPSSPAGV